MTTTHGNGNDAPLIRHAYARRQETIDRHEGESIAAFIARSCATFGPDAVIRLADAKGGTVAWTDDDRTIRPATMIPPG